MRRVPQRSRSPPRVQIEGEIRDGGPQCSAPHRRPSCRQGAPPHMVASQYLKSGNCQGTLFSTTRHVATPAAQFCILKLRRRRFSNRLRAVIVPPHQSSRGNINVGQGLASPVCENRGAVRCRGSKSLSRRRQAGGCGLARQRLSRRLCLGHGDLVLSGRGRDQRGRARGLDLGQVRPHPRQDRGRLDRRSRQTTRSVMSALRGKLQGSGDAEE